MQSCVVVNNRNQWKADLSAWNRTVASEAQVGIPVLLVPMRCTDDPCAAWMVSFGPFSQGP